MFAIIFISAAATSFFLGKGLLKALKSYEQKLYEKELYHS